MVERMLCPRDFNITNTDSKQGTTFQKTVSVEKRVAVAMWR